MRLPILIICVVGKQCINTLYHQANVIRERCTGMSETLTRPNCQLAIHQLLVKSTKVPSGAQQLKNIDVINTSSKPMPELVSGCFTLGIKQPMCE